MFSDIYIPPKRALFCMICIQTKLFLSRPVTAFQEVNFQSNCVRFNTTTGCIVKRETEQLTIL